MAIIGGYVSPASLYLEGSAMTMIDPDSEARKEAQYQFLMATTDDASYAWPTPEPKHRADVEPTEPAPVQHCGHCVTCDVCGEYVTG